MSVPTISRKTTGHGESQLFIEFEEFKSYLQGLFQREMARTNCGIKSYEVALWEIARDLGIKLDEKV